MDEEGEQYETYFFSIVDEGDLLAAAEAAGVEQAVCACSEKCVVGAVNTECAVCSVNMGKCVGAAPEPIAVISGRLSCPLIRRWRRRS